MNQIDATLSLVATRERMDAFLRARRGAALRASLIAVPIAVGILVFDYRLMILAVVVLVFPVIPLAEMFRVRKSAGPDGGAALYAGPLGITVQAASGRTEFAYGNVSAVRATPVAMYLVVNAGTRAQQSWVIPGERQNILAFCRYLTARGMTVSFDDASRQTAVWVVLGALLYKGLGVVAAGLVLGALANLGMAAMGHGGWLLGLGLLGGALLVVITQQATRAFIVAYPAASANKLP